MAIPTNIKTLLSGDVVEWARIEFKETWDPATSLKTVCAFANDLDNWGGGYIVIGVKEDNGRPMYPLLGVPLDKLDAYQKDIYAKCKLIRPAYTPIIGYRNLQDKDVHYLCVRVETVDHIHHLKRWQRIIKSEFIISVKRLILWNHQTMRRRIYSIWQIEYPLMIV